MSRPYITIPDSDFAQLAVALMPRSQLAARAVAILKAAGVEQAAP